MSRKSHLLLVLCLSRRKPYLNYGSKRTAEVLDSKCFRYVFSLQSIYDIYPKDEEIQIIEEHLQKVPAGWLINTCSLRCEKWKLIWRFLVNASVSFFTFFFRSVPLDKPEEFMNQLTKMKHFKERLECWLFQDKFSDIIYGIGIRMQKICL